MPNHRVWETCHFPRRANQIRTGDAGAKIPCLTVLAIAQKPAAISATAPAGDVVMIIIHSAASATHYSFVGFDQKEIYVTMFLARADAAF